MSITGALKKAVKDKTSSEVSNTPTIAIHDTGLLYKTEIDELKAEIARLRTENLILQEKVDLLTYKRFVRTSEKNDDGKQASLFNEDELIKSETEEDKKTEDETPVREHTRKKPRRKPLPENLRREVTINDLSDEEKQCTCGKELVRIGEDISEKLVIVPAQIYVEQTVTPKYVCPCCRAAKGDADAPSVIHNAPTQPAILPGSVASAQLLAYIFIAKFCDGLPYYRLEKQFGRIGVSSDQRSASRQDIANWQVAVFNTLTKLFELMMAHLKTGKVLRMDETTVQVMGEENRSDTQKSYIWLARGGPPGKIVILFVYKPTRASDNIDEFVDGFSGYLQTDGYEGYDCTLKRHPGIIHVGCLRTLVRYTPAESSLTP
ncbi:hypothetical protein FACS1894137_18260 [Spirochaetia bacterium]|nr:hypothetical protein FACS1894137_18260 [Spirochaetia bacterium]